jgi:predicted metal-dependent hydrolase
MPPVMKAAATVQIFLGDIAVDVVQKAIKNIHLSVYPPHGKVRIAAPLHMELDTIRVFAISKLGWIKQQQEKLRGQARQSRREYLDRESHYVWGKRYLLKVVEHHAPPDVTVTHGKLVLHLRPRAGQEKRQSVVDEWLREQLKAEVLRLMEKWAPHIGVAVPKFTARKMKTKWGSCTPAANSILVNLELAKKPLECLEYIVVHELTHLLEPSHNARFIALMTQFMPKWRHYRDELNRLPVRHEDWAY